MSQLRAGRVARIRVNPRDCMACVDIARKAGVHIPGMSFAQLVSISLSSMLEAYRQGGHIPTRDGFEYAELMLPFGDNPRVDRARKLAITETVHKSGSEVQVPPAPTKGSEDIAPNERARLDIRWNELALRRQLTPENFTPDEQTELNDLCVKLGYKVD